MNAYIYAAWAFTLLFATAALVASGVAVAAYLDWIRIDAVSAVAVAISFAGYTLVPLGYASDRS